MSLELIVKWIDPSLEFLGFAGEGVFARVAKVKRNGGIYALKIQNMPDIYPIDREFYVQRSLHDRRGIPKALMLYDKSAFLMEYVDGKMLYMAGKQPRDFFGKLREIAFWIVGNEYYLAEDFGSYNVMVDRKGDPWVIDFGYCNKERQILNPYADAENKIEWLELAFRKS